MTDEPAASQKGSTGHGPGPDSSAKTPEPLSHSELLTVTIEAKTGQIIKVEGSNGGRHELTDQERADLTKETAKDTFEALIEEAFEAGIAYVLGDTAGKSEGEESAEDADLRHLLLEDLIKNSAAQRLMRREVLSRAILGSVVRYATHPNAAPHVEKRSAQQRPGGATGKSHQRMQPPGRRHSGASLQHRGG